jgi:hypothetical protein
MHFGSSEWNRNVDGLSGLAVCLDVKDLSNIGKDDVLTAADSIITVYGQFQFHIFRPMESVNHSSLNKTVFNPKLSHCSDPTVLMMDDITHYIKVNK